MLPVGQNLLRDDLLSSVLEVVAFYLHWVKF